MPWYIKRIVLPGLVVIMALGVFVATQVGDGSGSPEPVAIIELIPGEGDTVLRQHRVGVVLTNGWDAALTLNGTPLPSEELDKTLELGHVFFNPGPDKTVPSLVAGENCVSARIWPLATGPEDSFTRRWCFRAG